MNLYDIYRKCGQLTTDSRDCPKGSLFVALKGESFNGNAFASKALEQGCAYAIIDEAEYMVEGDSRYILVEDSVLALKEIAREHRRQFNIPVIGITGTNGKTTTKELLAAVLSKKYNVLYTQGNFNNDIGVPKTLLRLNESHEIAVIEMGASHPGDIKTLAETAEPTCGLITNVGHAHLQGFGSFGSVVKTKGELYDFLRLTGGKVFIDEADNCLTKMTDGIETIPYVEGNVTENTPFITVAWQQVPSDATRFWPGWNVRTQMVGKYNLKNIMAAVTVGLHFGVTPEDINAAIADYKPTNNRSQLVKTERNTLIVDAYNANFSSMVQALDNFHEVTLPGKMVILGDMKELGEMSTKYHRVIAYAAAIHKFDVVWLVGEEFHNALNTSDTLPAQLQKDKIKHFAFFNDVEEVKEYLKEHPVEGRSILIKGSNGTRLYQLPQLL